MDALIRNVDAIICPSLRLLPLFVDLATHRLTGVIQGCFCSFRLNECVCACVYVCACVRVCVCACACACVRTQVVSCNMLQPHAYSLACAPDQQVHFIQPACV